MWAAEMTEHCGIGTWQQNSRVIHATSTEPGGTYTRKDVVWEVFSHEPEVVPGPDGQFIMYFTADLRSPDGICNCCRPGHGPCDGSTGPGDCDGGGGGLSSHPSNASAFRAGRGGSNSYMSFAANPNGPWSTPEKIFADYNGGDTNFAPLILKNGSIVAMWRHWGGGTSFACVALLINYDNERSPRSFQKKKKEEQSGCAINVVTNQSDAIAHRDAPLSQSRSLHVPSSLCFCVCGLSLSRSLSFYPCPFPYFPTGLLT